MQLVLQLWSLCILGISCLRLDLQNIVRLLFTRIQLLPNPWLHGLAPLGVLGTLICAFCTYNTWYVQKSYAFAKFLAHRILQICSLSMSRLRYFAGILNAWDLWKFTCLGVMNDSQRTCILQLHVRGTLFLHSAFAYLLPFPALCHPSASRSAIRTGTSSASTTSQATSSR